MYFITPGESCQSMRKNGYIKSGVDFTSIFLCLRKQNSVDDKAINIQWDVDSPEELEYLPTEIEIPEGMEDEDDISDYISDVTGFCHAGFELDTE